MKRAMGRGAAKKLRYQPKRAANMACHRKRWL